MSIKIIENFDSSFQIDIDSKTTLFDLLKHETFIEQMGQQLQGQKVVFTELIFQPVPYSKNTPKGMPTEFEAYHNSDDYVIINVPPNFMFKAKIFKPSRLCAVYRIIH